MSRYNKKNELFKSYRVIFESIPDAVYVIDFSEDGHLGKFLLTNEVSTQMLGYTREEFRGLSPKEILHPDDARKIKFIFEKINKEGFYKGEEVHVTKEGKNIPVEVSLKKTVLDNREVLIGFARDISAKQEVERNIYESELKYRSLVDQSPYAIAIHQDGKVVFVNKIGLDFIKADSEKDILNKPILDIVHPDYHQKSLDRIKRMLKGEKNLYPVIDRYVCLDGSELDGQVYAMPIQFNGRPAVQVTIRDITNELKSQKKLAESEERYRLLVENSPDAIIIHQEGKVVFVNESAVKLANAKSKEEMIGRDTFDFIHPESHKSSQERISKLAKGLKVKYPVQEKYLTLTGKVRHVDISLSRVTFNSKPAFQAIIRDITDRVKKDKKLKRYSTDLEKEVENRVKEINKQRDSMVDSQRALSYLIEDVNKSRGDLLVANRTLEAVNKELESFSYSVSHDLKAPLRRIDGYSDILIEKLEAHLDDQSKHYFERIKVACKDMAQLIEDLLILSRITKKDIVKAKVDISGISRGIISKLDLENKYTVEIEQDMEAEADPHLIEILLANLLNNAAKFSAAKPKPRIEVGSEINNDQQVFYIKDNGVGFNMKYYSRLYQPFQRLHSAEEFEGTGIGLATVVRIINRHHGEIWAEAEEGKGATFYFRI